tara:strand:- start:310 stop:1413 length:1104 start_codon:yes stop_codon:yes gene_type:complete
MAAVYTGGSASVLYGYEAAGSLGTAPAANTIINIFGLNQKVSSLSLQTGQMPLNKLGQVEVSKFAYGQQQGTVNLGFVWDSEKSDKIFKALFGAPSSASNVDTYPASSTIPFTGVAGASGSVSVSPSSPLSLTTQIKVLTPSTNADNMNDGSGGTNHANDSLTRTLKGCIVQSLALSTSIGEVLNATIDMAFAREDSTSVSITNSFIEQNATANDQATTPYTFAHGALQMENGASSAAMADVTEVQDVDITLSTNAELLWGLGSHHATNVFRKIFDVTGRFRTSFKNKALIQAVIDQSRVAGTETIQEVANVGLSLTFTNPSNKSLKIELGGISITDHSTSGIEPAEPIFEEVNFKAKSVRIVSDHT